MFPWPARAPDASYGGAGQRRLLSRSSGGGVMRQKPWWVAPQRGMAPSAWRLDRRLQRRTIAHAANGVKSRGSGCPFAKPRIRSGFLARCVSLEIAYAVRRLSRDAAQPSVVSQFAKLKHDSEPLHGRAFLLKAAGMALSGGGCIRPGGRSRSPEARRSTL